MKTEKMLLVEEFTTRRIYDKIVSTYPKSTQLILEGNFYELSVRFPGIMARLHSYKYKRDKRTIEQFASDVSIAWVLEDYVIAVVNYYTKINMRLSGTDEKREFQKNKNITNAADFVIKNNKGENVYIEFITDNFGYYNKIGKFYLRDNKLEKLRENSIKNKTMIMSLNLKDKTFFLQDVNDMRATRTEYYNKPANEVLIDFGTHKLTKTNVIEQFQKIND